MISGPLLDAIFVGAALALIALNILLLLTIVTPRIKLWPTPSNSCWQHYTFWLLFRGGLGLTLAFALLSFSWEADDIWRFGFFFGLALAILGFGFTIYGYFELGLRNTYGADDGLVTDGLYRYSRNPQYVASIAGFAGVAIAHGGPAAALLCGFSILVYVLLPFTEEPWLARAYGDAYRDYKARVPRFLIF